MNNEISLSLEHYKGSVIEKNFSPSHSDFLVKGKEAQIGEIREWSGQKYQKTANGWVEVTQGKQPGKEEGPKDGKDGKKEEGGGPQKLTPENLDKMARQATEADLQRTIKESGNEQLRQAAHKELERRQKEEAPKKEGEKKSLEEVWGEGKEEGEGKKEPEKGSEEDLSYMEKLNQKLKEAREEREKFEKENPGLKLETARKDTWSPPSRQPNYNWTGIQNEIWAASKSGKPFTANFSIPDVAEFELTEKGITIKPIGDLKTDSFKVGEGTNFDKSVIGKDWHKGKNRIGDVLGLLVKNTTRAAFAEKVNTKIKMTGFMSDGSEVDFNPSKDPEQLKSWVEDGPRVRMGRGSLTRETPELEEAIKSLSESLPKELDFKIQTTPDTDKEN